MTLVAAQETDDGIQLLADGLSCHDKLAIEPECLVGYERVLVGVPGRTTLKKLFPHPTLPLAIAQLGSNQRNGKPIGAVIEDFLQRSASDDCDIKTILARFQAEFGQTGSSETFWLVGFDSHDKPVFSQIGHDFHQLDTNRYWGGSGCCGLSAEWADLDSLKNDGIKFTERCQPSKPYCLPFFPNDFGGHWHRLDIKPGQSPEWRCKPISRGVLVSDLLPGRIDPSSDSYDPANYIVQRCIEFKKQLKRKYGKKNMVKRSLEKIADPTQRERAARLVAVFDEVELDSTVATFEDAQHYANTAKVVATDLALK